MTTGNICHFSQGLKQMEVGLKQGKAAMSSWDPILCAGFGVGRTEGANV